MKFHKFLDSLQPHDDEAEQFIIRAPEGAVLTMVEAKKPRSLDQNSLMYACYQDISKQGGDGVVDVRRRCKLHYGIPILRANDPDFKDVYDTVVKPHAYEDKLKIMDFLPVTSRMKRPQATEFIETLFREHPSVDFQYKEAG